MASLLLHALFIAAILWPATQFLKINDPGNPFLPPGGGGGGGGGGRESVAYISLPAFTPPPLAAEVVEVPPVETPVVPVVPDPVPVQDSVRADTQTVAMNVGATPGAGTGLTGTGNGNGSGEGNGTGPGSGPGTGPGSGGGNGLARPPSPKQMLIPPEGQPRELRNQTIRAMFSIDQNGKVERVEFDPEIRNRDYASKLREKLLAFRFNPARATDGRAVAVQYPIDITF